MRFGALIFFLWALAAGADEFADFPQVSMLPDAYHYTIQKDLTGLEKTKTVVKKEKKAGDFASAFVKRAKADSPPRVAVLFLTPSYCSSCQPKEAFDPVAQSCGKKAKVLHLLDDDVENPDTGAKVAYEAGKRPADVAGLYVFQQGESERFLKLQKKLGEAPIPGQGPNLSVPVTIVVVDGKVVGRVGGCSTAAETQAAIEAAVRGSKAAGTDDWKCQ